jgi:hypothetical protein
MKYTQGHYPSRVTSGIKKETHLAYKRGAILTPIAFQYRKLLILVPISNPAND